jgi:hypothetical protein
MNPLRLNLVIIFLTIAATASAQDATSIWNSLSQPAPDAAKSASVNNVVLTRDRIRITLTDGVIQFMQPAGGVVFGAAFRGHGHLQVSVPNGREAQQLFLFTKQDGLDLEFTDATFSFTDGTFDEVARQVHWSSSAAPELADLYQKKQHEREDLAAGIVPRLFQGVFSANREHTPYLAADVKTADRSWVLATFDALQPEEITVGQWTDWDRFKGFNTWLRFPAGGRASSDAYRDPLTKNIFLVHAYQIDAKVTGGAELSAAAKVKIEQHASGERVLPFVLDSNLRVDSVQDEKGGAIPFIQAREQKDRPRSFGDYLLLVLPQATVAGQSQTLEFRYAGKRVVEKVGNGNYFCESFGWYPTLDNSFATRADFEMTFRIPKKYTLVATANKESESNDGGETVSTWKTDVPIAVAGFAFGDYKIIKEKVGAIDLEIYANRQADDFMSAIQMMTVTPIGQLTPAAMAKPMTTEIANMLRVDQIFFGPYPYKRLAVTNIPYSYGQGWPMLLYLSALSFLDSTQRHFLGIPDNIRLTDFFRAHETSHQWWGHRVSWKSYHDQWLSEGFAQFSGNLYVQYRENMNEYLKRVRQDKQELLEANQYGHRYDSLGPVWMGERLSSSLAPAGYNVVVYDKGGLILHMLRMMLFDSQSQDPEQNFKAMMQDFCQTYDNKAASTEDFKAIVEKYMIRSMDLDGNQKMNWFFNQYVYGTGIPQYNFAYSMSENAGKWQVSGTVSQSGVPEGWKDSLPVSMRFQGRSVRLGSLIVKGKVSPFQFILPVKPDKIMIDENEDTLAVVKQP